MQLQSASGGLHDKRGNWFETQSLLGYFLARLAEGRKIHVVLESLQDAVFTYTDETGATLTELVQCKKIEAPARATRALEEFAYDLWHPGKATFSDLKDYLDSPAGNVPLLTQLESPGVRYTLLLFGKCNTDVQNFVPPPIDASGSHYHPAVIGKHFPPHLEHKPNSKRKTVGVKEVAQRVRVLPMPDPLILEAISQTMVVGQFNVSTDRAHSTVQRLAELFRMSSTSMSESRREVDSQQILQLLKEQASGMGHWHSSLRPSAIRPNWLSSEEAVKDDEPLWAEWNAAEALRILASDRAVVVCGPLASGKTSICRFVTREFRSQRPTVPTYYLEVRPDMTLVEELEFFSRSLQTPALFIIDDEQYAEGEVKRFVRAFLARASEAWLLVTSTHTYTTTQAFRDPHPLHALRSLKLEDHSPDELIDFLTFLGKSGYTLSEDQNRSIASAHQLTGGKLGFVKLLASAASKVPNQASPEALTKLQVSRSLVEEWTRQSLGLSAAEFKENVVPILLIATNRFAFLPVYKPGYLEKLRQIGVLSLRSDGRYEPQDPTLPLVVWQQHKHHTLDAVADYLSELPNELPHLFVCFAANDIGKRLAASLLRDKAFWIAEATRGLCDKDLFQVVAVLRAAFTASRDEGRVLYRDLVLPNAQWSTPTIARLLSCSGTKPIQTLTQLLEVLHKLDRHLTRNMCLYAFGPLDQPGPMLWRIIEILMLNAARPDVELSDIFQLMCAMRRCHLTLTRKFLDALLVSPAYKTKLDELGDADPGLVKTIRCCQELRSIDHVLYQEYLEKRLGKEQITVALGQSGNQMARMGLLRDVRRMSPRTAIDALRQLWTESPQSIDAAAAEATDIVSLVGVVRALDAVDQRIAVAFATKHQDKLCLLVDRETEQFRLASAVGTIHRISQAVGRKLGEHVCANDLAQRINSETDRLQLVGKTLSSYVDQRLPALRQVMDSIDTRNLLSRIDPREFLPTFVFLATGLFDAAQFVASRPSDAVSDLLVTILDLPEVTSRLKSAMEPATVAKHEVDTRAVAFAFSALRRCGLKEASLFRLFDIQNPEDLLQRIDAWVAAASDIMAAKELIYGMVLLGDFEYARRAVCGALNLLQERKPKRGNGERQLLSSVSRRAVNDLAELGDLFHIAAVVDDHLAVNIVESIDKTLVGDACRGEWNLGRHALLLQGLRKASWLNFQALVDEVYAHESRERIFDMVDDTENLNHLMHFTRELRLASHSTAANFFSTAIEGSRDRILALLSAEINLASASQWMRTASSIAAPQASSDMNLSLKDLLLEIQPYDGRLFSNSEAAVALAECGFLEEAKLFSDKVQRASGQITMVQSATDLMDILLRAQTIDRGLGSATCTQTLVDAIPAGMLRRVCGEGQPMVVSAYAVFALRRWFDEEIHGLRNELQEVAEALKDRVTKEVRWPLQRAVATVLTANSAEEARELLAKYPEELILQLRPWETGLLRVLLAALPGSVDAAALFEVGSRWHVAAKECSEDELRRRRCGFSGHASSIKLALALQSAPDVALCANEAIEGAKVAALRVAENYDPLTSLLLLPSGASVLADSPLYFKVLLSETVLTAFELDWASRMTSNLSDYFFSRR